jgi:hypothetical protein
MGPPPPRMMGPPPPRPPGMMGPMGPPPPRPRPSNQGMPPGELPASWDIVAELRSGDDSIASARSVAGRQGWLAGGSCSLAAP